MSTRHLKRSLTFSITGALLLSAACSSDMVRDGEKPVGQPESEERTDQLLPEERPTPRPITNVAPVLPHPEQGEGEGSGEGEEGGKDGEGEPSGGGIAPHNIKPSPAPPSPDEGITVNPGPNEL